MAAAESEQLSWADKPPFKRFFNFEVFEYRVRLGLHQFPHLSRCKDAVARSWTACDYRTALWLQGKTVRIHALWVGIDGPIKALVFKGERDELWVRLWDAEMRPGNVFGRSWGLVQRRTKIVANCPGLQCYM